ncbi:YbcC family protein [Ahrensia sp. R2A130]|uniref:YbcC family protein n=1 Tax=Ahrensia sp. R2A130 TaxID=744979 RepID=UPI0001E0C3BC|nr:DUF2309 domain-containing protein [Ahrensia sp. R2A130]EFL87623.1 putative YbcD [Ahrensia sp. R2A130]
MTVTKTKLKAATEHAIRAIPPLWPLSSSVAVNPFLGQADQSLAHVSAQLSRLAGTAATMPREWYRKQIEDGTIIDADLQAALDNHGDAAPAEVDALHVALAEDAPIGTALPTIADLAADVSGIDWPSLIAERIGAWAASYFDTGQALWQPDPSSDAFDSWRTFASRDLTPEIIGLSGFAAHVDRSPDEAERAIAVAAKDLGLTSEAAPSYFHQLLLGLGGWSQAARYRLWEAELEGKTDGAIADFLAIRIIWEQALYSHYKPQFDEAWGETLTAHASPAETNAAQIIDVIMQDAADRAGQRKLALSLAAPSAELADGRPALQAAFCIDVRSEVFRRALESIDPSIRTLGFAGFFGLTAAHRSFASDVVEKRLPVLLNSGVTSHSGSKTTQDADTAKRFANRAKRAWGRFKLAAVSSFAFVEATGPIYIVKLLKDALGQEDKTPKPEPQPHFGEGFALKDRIAAAGTILRAMSLTENFAPLVLIAGHGANTVNNPYASTLHCGACGGFSGEVNARLLAGMLNELAVREGLSADGIAIPTDTTFVAALHDTTTDEVKLYDRDTGTAGAAPHTAKAKEWLAAAGGIARTERALRFPGSPSGDNVSNRSRDWSQTRPEWALANCQAFIAAPRANTRGKNLQGRAFLHDYDHTNDDGYGILELIVTAPVVVASWISLQYYGSVVAPNLFGSGSKLLHNVTGGFGVVEGNGGLLRSGLPLQSVHDGTGYAHDPLRLSVCLQAPEAAITDILARHDWVRALFDNNWLHLFTLDDEGRMNGRYTGNLKWEAMEPTEAEPLPLAA